VFVHDSWETLTFLQKKLLKQAKYFHHQEKDQIFFFIKKNNTIKAFFIFVLDQLCLYLLKKIFLFKKTTTHFSRLFLINLFILEKIFFILKHIITQRTFYDTALGVQKNFFFCFDHKKKLKSFYLVKNVKNGFCDSILFIILKLFTIQFKRNTLFIY
jgi:hypothetical protein